MKILYTLVVLYIVYLFLDKQGYDVKTKPIKRPLETPYNLEIYFRHLREKGAIPQKGKEKMV